MKKKLFKKCIRFKRQNIKIKSKCKVKILDKELMVSYVVIPLHKAMWLRYK